MIRGNPLAALLAESGAIPNGCVVVSIGIVYPVIRAMIVMLHRAEALFGFHGHAILFGPGFLRRRATAAQSAQTERQRQYYDLAQLRVPLAQVGKGFYHIHDKAQYQYAHCAEEAQRGVEAELANRAGYFRIFSLGEPERLGSGVLRHSRTGGQKQGSENGGAAEETFVESRKGSHTFLILILFEKLMGQR